MKLAGSSIIVAVIASISAILIFQAIQSAIFSEFLSNIIPGNHTTKYLSLQISNITDEYVTLRIQKDQQVCKLKERESCYSSCYKITVSDIRADSVDLSIDDEITCEIGMAARNFAESIGKIFGR